MYVVVYIYASGICMYVCMDGCMSVWMYGCMDVCMSVWMYGCMYVCMVVNTNIKLCILLYYCRLRINLFILCCYYISLLQEVHQESQNMC